MFFYSIAIKIYTFLIYLVSPFHSKAKKAIDGRKHFFKNNSFDSTQSYIWFHCASLGEFEQGRPLIEKIKKESPEKKILLSFFSPSGYEIRKNYSFADKVIYLPFDSSWNAKKFFDIFHIERVVFVKYDIWPFYLKEILRRKIPVYLISAFFKKDHLFFKWYGSFLKKMIIRFNGIFVQDESSKKVGELNGLKNIHIAGDPRVDRVLNIKDGAVKMPQVEQFLGDKKCIILGSVYKPDVEMIRYLMDHIGSDFKLIVAPHQVDENVLTYFKNQLPSSIFYRELDQLADERILLIDHVGSLSQLYQFGCMAYIGGGFQSSIHNILEPAVFNIPVFFGPRFHKFPEANALIVEKLAFSHSNVKNLAKMMDSNLKETEDINFKQRSENWFAAHSGATDLIYNHLIQFF